MIQIQHNFSTNSESIEMIKYFKSNTELVKLFNIEGDSYYCKSLSIINNINKFSLFKRFNINQSDFGRRLNIQLINKDLQVLEKHHTHIAPYSFVIFLNDDFEGGELVFDNIYIKPIKNTIVYFTGDLGHHVKPVIKGDRYTLVGFTYSEINIKKYSNRNTI